MAETKRKKGQKRNLVIVESPAKARTLTNILGSEYVVKASIGHIRDLPKSKLGVDLDRGFAPHYVVPRDKSRVVRDLQDAARDVDMIYLATDPDREGEAIAWHLVQAAGLEGRSYLRAVFHEITPQAIKEAFQQPRAIDMQLVDAQQARRILDRLLGYKLSPLLWSKVRRGLSAGRVQSVALRLVVDRERDIQAFVPQEYWTIEAELSKGGGNEPSQPFRAKLVGALGKKDRVKIESQEQSQKLLDVLQSSSYSVIDIQRKRQAKRPAAPFTTSTLQQEASRRLRFTPKRTMALAQQLYEGLELGAGGQTGLITYMRTDSTNVSAVAVAEAREYIKEKLGAEYVPAKPQVYKKKAKGAQEAHEAIRPTSISRAPEMMRRWLSADQYKLYTLIWQRMLASQMADAAYEVTTVEVEAKTAGKSEDFLFRAVDTQIKFAGYRRLYEEGTDDDTADQLGTNPLPDLTVGQTLDLLNLLPDQHFTEPPPRFSEASLVKALEEKGVGRPSTYAPILSTIQERGYVKREDGRLYPTELGFVVNDILVSYFPKVVDVGFTARMEEELDDVARGDRGWQPVVGEFYEPLVEALSVAAAEAPKAVEETAETCDLCGRPMVIRWGRRGRFLACSGFPECRRSRSLDGEEAEMEQPVDERCPECDAQMVMRMGRFGPFLACSRYPECRGKKPLLKKVGVACPQCGGDLVVRRAKGRRGRIFYGCANYPKCKFAVWKRPVPHPCPQCSGLLMSEAENRASCQSCGWQGEIANQELAATPG